MTPATRRSAGAPAVLSALALAGSLAGATVLAAAPARAAGSPTYVLTFSPGVAGLGATVGPAPASAHAGETIAFRNGSLLAPVSVSVTEPDATTLALTVDAGATSSPIVLVAGRWSYAATGSLALLGSASGSFTAAPAASTPVTTTAPTTGSTGSASTGSTSGAVPGGSAAVPPAEGAGGTTSAGSAATGQSGAGAASGAGAPGDVAGGVAPGVALARGVLPDIPGFALQAPAPAPVVAPEVAGAPGASSGATGGAEAAPPTVPTLTLGVEGHQSLTAPASAEAALLAVVAAGLAAVVRRRSSAGRPR